MSEERTRRVGENEALYRQVNEEIEGISKGVLAMTGEFHVLCECGTLDCMAQIAVTHDVYDQTRSTSDRFIVLPGHQIDDLEAVISDHGTFYVIEKTAPDAKRVAEELDPRA